MNKLPRVFRSLTKWHAARPWSVTNIEPSTVNLPRSHGSLLWTTPQFHARKHWEKKKKTSSLLNFIRVYSTHKVAFFIFFRPKSKDLVLCQLEHGRTEVFQILLTGDRIPVTGKVSVICCWNPVCRAFGKISIYWLEGRFASVLVRIWSFLAQNLLFAAENPMSAYFLTSKVSLMTPPPPFFPLKKAPCFRSSCEASSKASWSLPQRSPWQLRAALGLAFGGCGDGYSNGMNWQKYGNTEQTTRGIRYSERKW